MMSTMAFRGLRVFCLGCSLAPCFWAASASADVVTTFDTGSEGWTVVGGGAGSWSGSVGNPAGSMVGTEGSSSGSLWYFSGPAEYLGDKSSHYGSSISWEILALDAGSGVTGTVADIVLMSPSGTIGYAILNNLPVLGSWKLNTVPLSETGWYFVDYPTSFIPTSVPVTQAQFQAILADLSGVYIQGEYFNGYDSAALDNVMMLDTSCPADFDGTGFVDTDDFDAFVHAFEEGSDDADFDDTGFVDTDDFDAFVHAFEAGC